MLEEIVSKYKLEKLLQPGSGTYAITDKNLKLIWCSNSFEDILKTNRIKRRDFSGLLGGYDLKKIKAKTLKLKLKNDTQSASIKILSTGKKTDGYLIKIIATGKKNKKGISSIKDDSEFVYELQDILTLLMKENSLSKLTNEIIKKSISISKSDYAIIVYNIQKETQKYDFTLYDPKNHLSHFNELKKEIGTNFSFLNKWLNLSKYHFGMICYSANWKNICFKPFHTQVSLKQYHSHYSA